MNYLRNERGSALAMTIILLMIVSVLGITMMYSITSEIRMNKSIEEAAVAKYLAQAGIDHALSIIENDDGTIEYPYSEVVELGGRGRMYEFTISNDEELILINSIGKIEENGVVKRQLVLEATINAEGRVVITQ